MRKNLARILFKKIECDGEMTVDRERWGEAIGRHVKMKYEDPLETSATQDARVQGRRVEQADWIRRGIPLPLFTVDIVLRARSQLCRGAAGGEDRIVNEMLLALCPIAIYIIFQLFFERFSGSWVDDLGSWRVSVLHFLKKVPNTCLKLSDCRIIPLTCAISIEHAFLDDRRLIHSLPPCLA